MEFLLESKVTVIPPYKSKNYYKIKMSSTTAFDLSTILDSIKDLESRLAGLKSLVSQAAKGKKRAKKERDPDAPKREPNDWIKFTQRVDTLLKGAEKSFHRVADSKKFASHLKGKKTFDEWTDEEILAEREIWTPPPTEQAPSEPLTSSTAEEAVPPSAEKENESSGEAEKKKPGRKPMTEEEKAAAKAKREAKKSAAAAAATESGQE